MVHLLTLSDAELLASEDDEFGRWLPEEDQWVRQTVQRHGWTAKAKEVNNAPNLEFGHGCYYFFICHKCPDWPVAMSFQR
jgi:hypothetical protein